MVFMASAPIRWLRNACHIVPCLSRLQRKQRQRDIGHIVAWKSLRDLLQQGQAGQQ
jgi:hypothetical protein